MTRQPSTSSAVAAIDVGSNSIRLVVARASAGGQLCVLDEAREATRLAAQLATTGRLGSAEVERTLACLKRFKEIVEKFSAVRVRIIATSAVREAKNGPAFCRTVRDEVGLPIEVITARQEAQLAFTSVQQAFEILEQNVAIADIGGGSMEVVFASSGRIEQVDATPLGAVRMAGELAQEVHRPEDELRATLDYVDRRLREIVQTCPFAPKALYGVGGTMTSLASLLIAEREEDPSQIRGYRVTRSDVRSVLQRLRELSPRQRTRVPGLSEDRADIIIPGVTVVDALMRWLEVDSLRVHTGGIRHGLLQAMLAEL